MSSSKGTGQSPRSSVATPTGPKEPDAPSKKSVRSESVPQIIDSDTGLVRRGTGYVTPDMVPVKLAAY